MIDVCCALIFRENRLLAVQRGLNSDHPGKWEFPGGKTEPGETAVRCIQREIAEELAVNIEVEAYLFPVCHDYGTKHIRLHLFICRISGGELLLAEHGALRWLTAGEMDEPDWLPPDRELLQLNRMSILERLGQNNKN